jgi:uncharacterized membrane protein YgcG
MLSTSSKRSFLNFTVFILTAFMGLVFASPSFAQYFTIQGFHSEVTIREDASLVIRETIQVLFHRPRHGIYREIPYKYKDEFGKTIKTPTKVISIKDGSGAPWKYKVSKSGAVVNLRIGDAKRYIRGEQVYVITYRVENAVLYFQDHDELYWNVTGNYWKAPIREASAEVVLALNKRSQHLRVAGYTGRFGSTESQCLTETKENGATFSSKRPLNMGEGLTIVFGWDKGLIAPPSLWTRFLWTIDIEENWVFALPLLALMSIAFLWHTRGRDPKVREAITVMYGPPKFNRQPLTPAEVGTLVDETFDRRDITSSIIGLAVKGYLRIEMTKEERFLFHVTDYHLKKMMDPDEALSPFERELMRSLFPADLPGVYVSSLKNKFYTNLETLRKVLYGELIRKKYFVTSPEKIRRFYVLIGVGLMAVGTFILAWLIPGAPGKGIVASILTGLPVAVFAKFMPAKTRAGACARMDILGFQEFMNRAEKDRLERMGDETLFSKFLPYAIALGVEDNWARAFEGVYQKAPEWYVSPGGFGPFRTHDFSQSINTVTSTLSSAMFSAPRGSGTSGGGGFGGGGSSGGGFGGGGGGSW